MNYNNKKQTYQVNSMVCFLIEGNMFMKEDKENVTKYGECIPTNFTWLSLEKQKEKADKLANIGKKKHQTKKNEK